MRKNARNINKKGETLTEMLVAVLIGALATAMLATSIGFAVRTTKKVEDTDSKLRQDIDLAESQSGKAISGTISIPDMQNGVNKGNVEVPVYFYGNDNIMSFKPSK